MTSATDNRTTDRVDHSPRVRDAIDELMRKKDATDNLTNELREKLTERGVKWWPMRNNGYYEDRDTEFVVDGKKHTAHEWGDGLAVYNLTPEQAIAAMLGNERDEIYNAGFDSGVKACLQILDGYLDYPHSAVENISMWVDEQWKERES